MAERQRPMHESVGSRGEIIRIRPELTAEGLADRFMQYQRDRELLVQRVRTGDTPGSLRALSEFIIRYQIPVMEGNRGFREHESDLFRNGLTFVQGTDPMGWEYRFYANIKFIHDQLLPSTERRLTGSHGPSLWDRFEDWAVTGGADSAEFRRQRAYAAGRLAAMRRHLGEAIEIMERPGNLSNSVRMAYAMGRFADYLQDLNEFNRSLNTMQNVFRVTPGIELAQRIRNVVMATAASIATGQAFGSASLLVSVPASVTAGQLTDYFFSGHAPSARKIMADLMLTSLIGRVSHIFKGTRFEHRAEALLSGGELGKNFYLEFGMGDH